MDTTWIKLGASFLHPYIFTTEYMYVDSENYEIDKIINDSDIGYVNFNKYEGTHPEYPGFKICMVKCFKWREYEMEKVLHKLDWVLNVKCGRKYTDFRDYLFNQLDELKE